MHIEQNLEASASDLRLNSEPEEAASRQEAAGGGRRKIAVGNGLASKLLYLDTLQRFQCGSLSATQSSALLRQLGYTQYGWLKRYSLNALLRKRITHL